MLPKVTGKEVLNALLKQGFVLKRSRGSHFNLEKTIDEKTHHVTVHVHAKRELNPKVMKSIIRQSGYSEEEFANLFQ